MCSFNRLKCKNINKKDVPNVSSEDIKLTSSSHTQQKTNQKKGEKRRRNSFASGDDKECLNLRVHSFKRRYPANRQEADPL